MHFNTHLKLRRNAIAPPFSLQAGESWRWRDSCTQRIRLLFWKRPQAECWGNDVDSSGSKIYRKIKCSQNRRRSELEKKVLKELYKSPLVESEASIVMRESTRRNRPHECLSVAIEKGGKTAITRHLANIHWHFGRRWGLWNGVALNCAPWQQRKTVRNLIARVSFLYL